MKEFDTEAIRQLADGAGRSAKAMDETRVRLEELENGLADTGTLLLPLPNRRAFSARSGA
ncbi:MAG: hypothetical protein IPP45_06645 [Sphingomonadales bacterium]|nr:hypothetical protein [Sphingomonadales bacterium]